MCAQICGYLLENFDQRVLHLYYFDLFCNCIVIATNVNVIMIRVCAS